MRQEVKIEQAINLTKYPNKELEGYYLGHRLVTGKFKEQLLHDFKKPDGKKVSVYGFTSLNINLEQMEVGTKVWVTYLGKSKEANKYGQQTHMCKVECDFDDVTEVQKKAEIPESTEPEPEDLPF
jgi:hypothetical protein